MSKDDKDYDQPESQGRGEGAAPRSSRSTMRAVLEDDLFATASAPAVALGMLYLDAALNMGISMGNAVAEQQKAWSVQSAALGRTVDLILGNTILTRAAELLLADAGKTTVVDKTTVAVDAARVSVKCPNGC